jgi:hypothetical protein
VPAQAPSALPGQDDACLPAVPQGLDQVVGAPDGELVDHAPAPAPDHILGKQMPADVGKVRSVEQCQHRPFQIVAGDHAAGQKALHVPVVVSGSRGQEAHVGGPSPNVREVDGVPAHGAVGLVADIRIEDSRDCQDLRRLRHSRQAIAQGCTAPQEAQRRKRVCPGEWFRKAVSTWQLYGTD